MNQTASDDDAPLNPDNLPLCTNPPWQTVREWFREAENNTARRPGARQRRDYKTPSSDHCLIAAHQLNGLVVNRPLPRVSKRRDWWEIARSVWVVAADAWRASWKQPFRINADSAIVHFVFLALSHFGIHKSKSAITTALQHFKSEHDAKTGGTLAHFGPGIMIITTNPKHVEGWPPEGTLKTKSSRSQKKPPT